jgi:hypothetical protein
VLAAHPVLARRQWGLLPSQSRHPGSLAVDQ